MSKISRLFLLTFTALVLILQSFSMSVAQAVDLHVDAELRVVHVVLMIGDVRPAATPLTFLADYAGIRFPNDRIRNIQHDERSWSYDVDLSANGSPTAAAHVSWLTSDAGILRLRDLLPQTTKTGGSIKISIPPGWMIATPERIHGLEGFKVEDFEGAAFYLNHGFRGYAFIPGLKSKDNVSVSTHISSHWQFSDTAAEELVSNIFVYFSELFGRRYSRSEYYVYIGKLPDIRQSGVWAADTHRRNITILSSDTAFGSQSLQQLHEQLRHEMFHLWIPEGVHLTGNYDWFYEGFAVYQSLKLGVAANRIRFDDYLDTLSRAYDIDNRLGSELSLIEASRNRWNGDNNTVVYARGMLVAFLCDLALMNASKGKLSTDDIVREVYRRHSGNAPVKDGNDAVISILKDHRELVPIVDENVSGTKQIDWSALITAAGLQAGTVVSGVTTLKVIQKPSGSQKRLLDKLGYNNWRKLKLK